MSRIPPQLLKAAASGEVISYPIPAEAALYRRVPVCRVGQYHPQGVRTWDATPELLGSLASTYDPQFYPATLNCDHFDWWGPAEGVILSLEFDSSAGVLYADLAVFNSMLAWQIDSGMWPCRSIEWWQEELLGEPFYGRSDKPNYLMGLGLLGVQSPAVPELGPMPARQADPLDGEPEPETLYYPAVNPLAAQAISQRALRLIQTNQEAPPVPDLKPAASAASTSPPAPAEQRPAESPQATQELAAALRERDQLREENVRLREADRQKANTAKLDALKAGGQVTGAQLEQLLKLAGDPAQDSAFNAACEVLAAGVAQVSLGESTPPGSEPPEANDGRAAPAGVARTAEAARVKAYQDAHKCSYQEAYDAVMAGGQNHG